MYMYTELHKLISELSAWYYFSPITGGAQDDKGAIY